MTQPSAVQTTPPMRSRRGDDGWISVDTERFMQRRAGVRDGAGPGRRCDYGRGMPSVSGATFALPPVGGSHALACTAGNTAFCASAPA